MMDEPPRLGRPQFYFVPTVSGGEAGGRFSRLEIGRDSAALFSISSFLISST